MNRKITTLYDHYKNTPKKLKIVCDWDEVIQACEPYALWLALEEKQKKKQDNFPSYFKHFWNESAFEINYFPYGSKLDDTYITTETIEKQIQIKNSPNFYQEAPFLTIAEDLLRLIEEDKVEKLIFLSAFDERVFQKTDQRKEIIFSETFGKIPLISDRDVKGCQLILVPFSKLFLSENEFRGTSKADWIKHNASDFDLVIDDNPNICRSLVREKTIKLCEDCDKYQKYDNIDCRYCEKMNITVLAPYYPAVENQHDEKVLLVKQEVVKIEEWENYGKHEK